MNKRHVKGRYSKFNQNLKSRPPHSTKSLLSLANLIVATLCIATSSFTDNLSFTSERKSCRHYHQVLAFVTKYQRPIRFHQEKLNNLSFTNLQHSYIFVKSKAMVHNSMAGQDQNFDKKDENVISKRNRKNYPPKKPIQENKKFTKYEQTEKADLEIVRLSKELKLTVPQLLIQLRKNRPKMQGEKAILVDHLLTYSSAANNELNLLKDEKKQSNSSTQPIKKLAKEEINKNENRRKNKVVRPARLSSRSNKSKEEIIKAQARIANSIKDPSLLTNENFSERTDMHPSSRRAVQEILGLTKMTEVQAKTFAAASSGKDVLARARTGTGKTLAFLLPAIEVILQNTDAISRANIGVLVVSPTRELATQIGDQASSLITFHEKLSVQVVFGGTKIGSDINKMSRRIPSILVATPGRLLDHLESTKINGRPFSNIVSNTKVLILDETDRLLDMGFRREIKKIINFLPRKRQTLLFSATIPGELKNIMSETMQEDSITVDCINDGDGSSHTNAHVKQTHVILPSMDRYVSGMVEIITKAMEDYKGHDEHVKIVVFFSTARSVGFFSDLFNKGLQIPVIELHSKKSQSYRNRASDQFRNTKSGILFTSDVSARGVDYPDVTHVIQVRFLVVFACKYDNS